MLNQIGYNIKQAFQQIGRNKGMSFASIFAITAMMLILGIFFVVSVNVNLFTETIKQDYDTVEIYLKDDVTAIETKEIMQDIKTIPGVSNMSYRTKGEALDIMRERWGESAYLLDSLGKNPLPNSILIHVDNLKSADRINKMTEKIDGIESTKYYKETVDKLTRITSFLQFASLVIMIFLIVVSILVVSNTIKLTVFARDREISIMKYIGATNWFIRGPFLVEGILMGIISSLISVGILYVLYSRVVSAIGFKVMSILSSPLVPADYMANNLIIIFMAIGIGIGAGGSVVSMRKFLDA